MANVLDDLLASQPQGEDPKAFIEAAAARIRAGFDLQILEALSEEIARRVGDKALDEFERANRKKSAVPRWVKSSGIVDEIQSLGGPTLLPAGTLDEQLRHYFKYVSHVEECWSQSRDSFVEKRYPFSCFFSILTIEETGKFSTLWTELLHYDQPRGTVSDRKDPRFHHVKKHVLATGHGAVINSRLDRILGAERVNELVSMAESGQLEKFRQSCLYAGVGDYSVPTDAVTEVHAKDFCILAGEIMADVLGGFPWEWERLQNRVSGFERSIGIDI